MFLAQLWQGHRWALLSGCTCVQVSMHVSACFSWALVLALPPGLLCVCVTVPGQRRLVCSGPSRGLNGAFWVHTPYYIVAMLLRSVFLHINRNKEIKVSQPLSAVFLAHSWRDLWAVSYKVVSSCSTPGLATECLRHNLFL